MPTGTAQEPPGPRPDSARPLEEATLREEEASRTGTAKANPSDLNLVEATLHWGRLVFRPGASYGISYNDNIFAGRTLPPGATSHDIIHRLALDFQAGLLEAPDSHFSIPIISYSPEYLIFHNNSDRDTLNHTGRLRMAADLPRTFFYLDHDSSDREDISAESAQRERQQIHNTILGINYDLGEKTQLESRTSQTFSDYSVSFAVKEWREDLWMNYRWREKLSIAAGVSGGYAMVDTGLNSYLNAEQIRFQYTPTEKLAFELRGGGEVRFFDGVAGRTVFGPIAGLTTQYRPRDNMLFSLIADRQAHPSSFAPDQLVTTSGFSLMWDQRFREKFFANIGAGYAWYEYDQARATAATLTSFEGANAKLEAGYDPTRRWRASVFYRLLSRTGGAGIGAFTVNEIGMTASYHF